MGRRRIYEDDAARKRAHRDRVASEHAGLQHECWSLRRRVAELEARLAGAGRSKRSRKRKSSG